MEKRKVDAILSSSIFILIILVFLFTFTNRLIMRNNPKEREMREMRQRYKRIREKAESMKDELEARDDISDKIKDIDPDKAMELLERF